MKKILTSVFALGLVLSLGACGGKKATSSSQQSQSQSQQSSQADPLDTVLEDKESNSWALHGNFLLADGETVNGWNGKDNELYEASKMTAISINQAKAINAELGATLATKDVQYLYKYEGAVLGTNDAGWSDAKFKMNDKLYFANGSYAFKAVKLSYDAEEEVYAEEQWMPHDHDGNTENLTPNVLWTSTNFAEEPDEDGFSWDYNPVAKEAGVYTIVFAQYKAGGTYSYAVGIVKTQAKEGIAFTEIVDWVAEDHTYGLIGSFNEWAADVAMAKDGEAWKAIITVEADAEFKVRADGAWQNAWGAAAVDADASSDKLDLTGDNIKATAAASFEVSISFPNGQAKIVVGEVA